MELLLPLWKRSDEAWGCFVSRVMSQVKTLQEAFQKALKGDKTLSLSKEKIQFNSSDVIFR